MIHAYTWSKRFHLFGINPLSLGSRNLQGFKRHSSQLSHDRAAVFDVDVFSGNPVVKPKLQLPLTRTDISLMSIEFT